MTDLGHLLDGGRYLVAATRREHLVAQVRVRHETAEEHLEYMLLGYLEAAGRVRVAQAHVLAGLEQFDRKTPSK